MGLSAYSGYFTISNVLPSPSGTGNLAVTGLGFQPKLVIFFPLARASDGNDAHSTFAMGASTGSGNNFTGFMLRDQDNVATSSSGRAWSSSHCIAQPVGTSNAIDYSGTMISLDADGFTVNIDNAAPASRRIYYLALGGTDIDNVEVGSFALTTSAPPATQDVTLAGAFQPTGLILLSCCATNASEDWATAGGSASIGVTDGTSQYCATTWADSGELTGDYARQQFSDAIFARLVKDGTINSEIAFNSFLSNGFRLSVTTTATAMYCVYIAIRGPQFKAGDYTANTNTTDITSESAACGFTPSALLIATALTTAWDSAQADEKLLVGATTATEASRANSNFMQGIGADEGADPTDSNTTHAGTMCSGSVQITGGTDGTQHLKSFDASGFTLFQAVGSSAANLHAYLAIGAKAVAGAADRGHAHCVGCGRGIMRQTI